MLSAHRIMFLSFPSVLTVAHSIIHPVILINFSNHDSFAACDNHFFSLMLGKFVFDELYRWIFVLCSRFMSFNFYVLARIVVISWFVCSIVGESYCSSCSHIPLSIFPHYDQFSIMSSQTCSRLCDFFSLIHSLLLSWVFLLMWWLDDFSAVDEDYTKGEQDAGIYAVLGQIVLVKTTRPTSKHAMLWPIQSLDCPLWIFDASKFFSRRRKSLSCWACL